MGVYRPTKNYELPVLEALKNTGLKVTSVSAGTSPSAVLKGYDVLVFPQGNYHQADLPAGEVERIKEMVKGGLGYIGICAGTIFAKTDLGIVDAEWRSLTCRGLMKVSVLPLPFWGAYGGRNLVMHFANGGYFVSGRLHGWEPLILSRNLGLVAIQGRYGLGHVILFNAHPEGGGITLNNRSLFTSGRDLQTGRLLLQAILMARPSR